MLLASRGEDGEALAGDPRGCGERCKASELCSQMGQVTPTLPCHQPTWQHDSPYQGIPPTRATSTSSHSPPKQLCPPLFCGFPEPLPRCKSHQ